MDKEFIFEQQIADNTDDWNIFNVEKDKPFTAENNLVEPQIAEKSSTTSKPVSLPFVQIEAFLNESPTNQIYQIEKQLQYFQVPIKKTENAWQNSPPNHQVPVLKAEKLWQNSPPNHQVPVLKAEKLWQNSPPIQVPVLKPEKRWQKSPPMQVSNVKTENPWRNSEPIQSPMVEKENPKNSWNKVKSLKNKPSFSTKSEPVETEPPCLKYSDVVRGKPGKQQPPRKGSFQSEPNPENPPSRSKFSNSLNIDPRSQATTSRNSRRRNGSPGGQPATKACSQKKEGSGKNPSASKSSANVKAETANPGLTAKSKNPQQSHSSKNFVGHAKESGDSPEQSDNYEIGNKWTSAICPKNLLSVNASKKPKRNKVRQGPAPRNTSNKGSVNKNSVPVYKNDTNECTDTDQSEGERGDCESLRKNSITLINALLPSLSTPDDLRACSDELIFFMVKRHMIPFSRVNETFIQPSELYRVAHIRRMFLELTENFVPGSLTKIPCKHLDYTKVPKEIRLRVVGYIPFPLGMAGPIILTSLSSSSSSHNLAGPSSIPRPVIEEIFIPMATTEGCLVASVQRGTRALKVNGVQSTVYSDFTITCPLIGMPTAMLALDVVKWLGPSNPSNFHKIKAAFESAAKEHDGQLTVKINRLTARPAGKMIFLRLYLSSGDSMDQRLARRGTWAVVHMLRKLFPQMELLSINGNYGADGANVSAINWIEGHGKSVVAEAVVPGVNVVKILKTTARDMVRVNRAKNVVGSSIAGTIGGFNAHAANIVASIFVATGQDVSHVVGSSNCLTQMAVCGPNGEDLHISVTMPSIDVATMGGGTEFGPQAACLKMLGVQGPHPINPGENARKLARIIGAAVLAGELSLMAALATNQLVSSHMRLNRSKMAMNNTTG